MNTKKLIAILTLMCFMFTLMPVAAMAEGETVTVSNAEDLKNAIQTPNTAIKFSDDVTSIDLGSIWCLNVASGVIIDGNNKTLTVDEITQGSSNAIFYSSSGSFTVKNLTINAKNADMENKTAAAIDLTKHTAGGTVENVTVTGKFLQGVLAGSNAVIKNCIFNNNVTDQTYGVYVDERGSHSNITISGNEFNTPRAAVLRGSDVSFTNNTVNDTEGETKGISVATSDVTITDNIFNSDRALSISANGVQASDNKIAGKVETNGNTVNLSGNYWGNENGPADAQIVGENATVNSYYTDADMKNPEFTDSVVATVNGQGYTSLAKAIEAATKIGDRDNPATIEIIKNIETAGDGFSDSFYAEGVIINGNKHTVNGLTTALIKAIGGGAVVRINDLTIAGSTMTGGGNQLGFAAFVGNADGAKEVTLKNCHLENSTLNGADYTGAFVGYAAGYNKLTDGPVFLTVTIDTCSVSNTTINAGGSAGALMGHASGNIWTKVIVKDTTVSENTVHCNETGRTDKVGVLFGTIGVGQIDTENAKDGGVYIESTTVSENKTQVAGAEQEEHYLFGRIGSTGGTIKISGGTYKNISFDARDVETQNGKFEISGGDYSSSPVTEEYNFVAEGYMETLLSSGDMYRVHKEGTDAEPTPEPEPPILPVTPSTGSSGGGFSGKYNYAVNVSAAGADVTLSDNYAVAGETVTITVNPDMGKKVDEVIVTDADGDIIPVTKVGDNKYTFVMPEGKVNVSVTTENADYDQRIVLQINNKNIVVNNKTITNDVSPVIVDGRTLVPVRIVIELLGGTADWDEATRTVTLTIDGKVLKLVIDEEIPGYGTGAMIINDRTYVPIRYISEMLGAEVEWIAATQQIVIEQ